jgi:adenine deaminase
MKYDKKTMIDAAMGRIKCDLVLRGGKIIDVRNHKIIESNLGIKDGYIVGIGDYEGENVVELEGKYVSPGFTDSHLHIESSMLTPAEYAKIAVPFGVTTLIADPHEIVNVCGEAGLKFMIEQSKNLPVDIYYVLPSCVPATPFDDAGCVIDGDKTKELMEKYNLIALGEMMNYPGVIYADEDVIKKLNCAEKIDGHAPVASGMELNAYICGGVDNDHECTTAENALEKVSCGMNVFIREGTGAKNLEELIKAVTPYNMSHFSFCTDDKALNDVLKEGTISHCINKAVSLGMDNITAFTLASYNAAVFYGLDKKGAIVPGNRADLVVCDSDAKTIFEVYKDGKLVAKDGKALFETVETDKTEVVRTVFIKPVTASDFEKKFDKNEPAIVIEQGSLITKGVYCDTADGLNLCANVERHKASGKIGKCFVKGFDIKNGAVAQTIGHDSHNISVIGDTAENMAAAVNALGENGGIAVVENGKVTAYIELEIAGLLSSKKAEEALAEHDAVIEATRKICPDGSSTLLMILSFISLLVIPELKLSDRGLFDVNNFKFL